MYIVEYYSTIKKNEIMPFAPTWMLVESIIRSEVREIKTNTTWYHLYIRSKKTTNKKTPRLYDSYRLQYHTGAERSIDPQGYMVAKLETVLVLWVESGGVGSTAGV